MFGSNIIDVAIGLIFLFLLMSLICSAANEILEGVLKKRARDLEKGIGELIGDPKNQSGLIKEIYNHGLVNGLFRGDYSTTSKGRLPSYIPAKNFALALLQVKEKWPALASAAAGAANNAAGEEARKAADKGATGPARPVQDSAPPVVEATRILPANLPKNVTTAFEAFEKLAGDDAAKLQASVEDWYNSSMDRVSGWYKRRSQYIILSMGLVAAVAINADCIEIAKRLSNDSSLRQGVVAMAEATAKTDQAKTDPDKSVDSIKTNINLLDSLGLPIGWPPQPQGDKTTWEQRLIYALSNHSVGWLLTALAVSLGAPFWFDMLNKLIVVRSTVKPHEKSREEKSKDAESTPASRQNQPGAG